MKSLGWFGSMACALALVVAGCTTVTTLADDGPGEDSGKYADPREQSGIEVLSAESSDLHAACDMFVGKVLAHPRLARESGAPHFVVESELFKDESRQKLGSINPNLVVDLLRSTLLQQASGRIVLVGREYAPFVVRENTLRDYAPAEDDGEGEDATPPHITVTGPVGTGTTAAAHKTLGADYFIGGRITDLKVSDHESEETYTQVIFEVVDAKTAEIVMSDVHAFKKSRQGGSYSWL